MTDLARAGMVKLLEVAALGGGGIDEAGQGEASDTFGCQSEEFATI